MSEIWKFNYSWAWRHRVFVRTTITCVIIFIATILAKGVPDVIEDPVPLLFFCGIFILLNLTVVPGERVKTKQIIIEGKTVHLIQYNNITSVFEMSDITNIDLIKREEGFRGYLLEQILIKVKGKGEFYVSVNINNYKTLCSKLSFSHPVK